MNIFYLDQNPVRAAQMHCDKHVVKMIVETAQMLSTAHRVLDGDMFHEKSKNGRRIKRWKLDDPRMESNLYKAVHVNHPSAVWIRECRKNYVWAYHLFIALCDEYTYRYKKIHSTDTLLRDLLILIPRACPSNEYRTTPIPLCMPEEYKTEDAVESYQNYYLGHKMKFAKWTGREVPEWVKEKQIA